MNILKFDEFVNEGLISDYKAKEEATMKELSNSDKKFVLDLLGALNDIGMDCSIYCINSDKGMRICRKPDDTNNSDAFEEITLSAALKKKVDDIPMSGKSIFYVPEQQEKTKPIHVRIYHWFEKQYSEHHDKLKFQGKMRISFLLEIKDAVQKELL